MRIPLNRSAESDEITETSAERRPISSVQDRERTEVPQSEQPALEDATSC